MCDCTFCEWTRADTPEDFYKWAAGREYRAPIGLRAKFDLPPQICRQCAPDRSPKPVKGQWDGWGTQGDLTLYQLECGHQFLIHTPQSRRPETKHAN